MNAPATARDAFWQFSLEIYSRPQVADLCLGLQDEHGFDVNIVLLCLWLARDEGRILGLADIRLLRAGAAHLNENLVLPIRQARRWARTMIDPAADPRIKAERQEFYSALKAIELRAEHLVQMTLPDCIVGAGGTGACPPSLAAQASLENYRQAIAAPDASAAILAQLAVIALA